MMTKAITVAEKNVKLEMLDTAGQEKYNVIAPGFYQMAQGIIVAFNLTDRDSFEYLKHWMGQAKDFQNPDLCKVMIGTKVDLEEQRQVTYEEGEEMA
mmetsp:Transcript_13836/g.23605  ORF Transcript_13836/g.23605 Transcript_13836/m.23605 type:complete len:97 (+) Transcript_13836:160-450(+)|eukprot:CAMPEP_0168624366 /NCGR_PEP_ID=MMETSP0449_2-20121227/9360_1 /TAXON_ID=1082188 /ORGANISM="Strombidium rassoulzadegani, Strain ras09" /LENGTH=96 /DNA_ID=CAMNT_0008665889 /DNA_START=104 /DNA_END=394 /DNA_ORIENTATION=-